MRFATLLTVSILGACSGDGGPGGTTGEAPSLVQATATTSPTVVSEPPEDDPTAEVATGLAFDPVTGRLIIPEAGPPPARPLRTDAKLANDTLHSEELTGVTLKGTFAHRDLPAAFSGLEVDPIGITAAAKLTQPAVAITMTALGRMKIVFESRALPLPFRSEIRARQDRFGNLIFWPTMARYRVVPPGALRTVLGEQRVDVTPLSPGQKTQAGTGKRLEQPTRTVELEAPLGKIRLEFVSLPEAGLGGPLLCRALVELVGIDPASSECMPEEVPFFAAIDWKEGRGIDFSVNAFERRNDLAPSAVLVPPPASTRSDDALPVASEGVYLTQQELAAFRTREVDVGAPDPAAPPDGFIAENGRDRLMVLFLDGVPVVAVPALDKRFIIGPLRGRYVAQWRTFLGDRIDAPTVIELPGIIRSVPVISGADAGVP